MLRNTAAFLDGAICTLELFKDAEIPAGKVGGEKVTVPENPCRLDTVTIS